MCKCYIILYSPITHTFVHVSVPLSRFTAKHVLYYASVCVPRSGWRRIIIIVIIISLTPHARNIAWTYRCTAGGGIRWLTREICPRPSSPQNIIHFCETRRSHRACSIGGGPLRARNTTVAFTVYNNDNWTRA